MLRPLPFNLIDIFRLRNLNLHKPRRRRYFQAYSCVRKLPLTYTNRIIPSTSREEIKEKIMKLRLFVLSGQILAQNITTPCTSDDCDSRLKVLFTEKSP